VISVGGPLTEQYLPAAMQERCNENRYPLAILPPYTNERLAAQQGVFTIHGHQRDPIEAIGSPTGDFHPITACGKNQISGGTETRHRDSWRQSLDSPVGADARLSARQSFPKA